MPLHSLRKERKELLVVIKELNIALTTFNQIINETPIGQYIGPLLNERWETIVQLLHFEYRLRNIDTYLDTLSRI